MKTALVFLTVAIVCLGLTTANDIDEKIFNGLDAYKGQFPYQVFLNQISFDGVGSFCGGSLISFSWVMTAAHCSNSANLTKVIVGLTSFKDSYGAAQYIVPRENHFVHPGYVRKTLENDIALLKLPQTLKETQLIKLINLPKLADAPVSTFDKQMATITGWGQTRNNESGYHQILQFRTVGIMERKLCAERFASVNPLTDGMICTEKNTVNAGSCPGDSGGPLALNGTDGKPVAIGVGSFILGQCENPNPVVFTYVPYHLKWINNVTGITIS